MEILKSVNNASVNISSITEVLNHIVERQMLISSRLVLSNIEGSSSYQVKLFVNNIEVYPDPAISVSGTDAIFQSRAVWVDFQDEISVRAAGTVNDLTIGVDCVLLDVSPPSVEELTNTVNNMTDILEAFREEQLRLYDREILGA